MIKRKNIFPVLLFYLMLFIAMSDGIRYLRPGGKEEKIITEKNLTGDFRAEKIIMAYNAWGGIVPGTVDFLHKFFLPASYPCNLCNLSYGFFGMKKEWKHFLDSLPYEKVYLHKDEVRKKYIPADLPLPAIFLSDSSNTKLLVSAAEINGVHNLDSLIGIVKNKLSDIMIAGDVAKKIPFNLEEEFFCNCKIFL